MAYWLNKWCFNYSSLKSLHMGWNWLNIFIYFFKLFSQVVKWIWIWILYIESLLYLWIRSVEKWYWDSQEVRFLRIPSLFLLHPTSLQAPVVGTRLKGQSRCKTCLCLTQKQIQEFSPHVVLVSTYKNKREMLHGWHLSFLLLALCLFSFSEHSVINPNSYYL